MGVLDDAIKEHLELKRKHGAPEEEVQRQEEEALGPVRREAAQQPESVEAEAEAAATDGGPAAPEPGPQEPAAGDEVAEGAEPSAEEQLFDGEAPAPEEPEAAAAEQPAEVLDEQPVAEEAPSPEVAATEEPLPDPEAPEPAVGPGDTPPRGIEPVEEEPRGADPGATVEYDPFADEELEDRAASDDDEDENGEGDVLEDTPDFLQETPEHDRLWFEQKPPRDFDFE
jgi:hypothetical protein